MTNKQMINLAKKAGLSISMFQPATQLGDELHTFAELVRNQTLEEAASACESLDEASGPCSWHYEIATQDCATAIRSMKK